MSMNTTFMKEYLIEQFELKHLYFDTKFIKLLSDEDIKILYTIINTSTNKSDNNVSSSVSSGSYNYEINEAYKNNKYDLLFLYYKFLKEGIEHEFVFELILNNVQDSLFYYCKSTTDNKYCVGALNNFLLNKNNNELFHYYYCIFENSLSKKESELSKIFLKNCIDLIDTVDDENCGTIYEKFMIFSIIKDFDNAFTYLIKYIENKKCSKLNCCRLELNQKLKIKLYMHLKKLNKFGDICKELELNNPKLLWLNQRLEKFSETKDCPICLTDQKLVPISCSHSFCPTCLCELDKCAICRADSNDLYNLAK